MFYLNNLTAVVNCHVEQTEEFLLSEKEKYITIVSLEETLTLLYPDVIHLR